MGWEWFRRLEVAEASRGMRAMSGWEAGEKFWDKRILDRKLIPPPRAPGENSQLID